MNGISIVTESAEIVPTQFQLLRLTGVNLTRPPDNSDGPWHDRSALRAILGAPTAMPSCVIAVSLYHFLHGFTRAEDHQSYRRLYLNEGDGEITWNVMETLDEIQTKVEESIARAFGVDVPEESTRPGNLEAGSDEVSGVRDEEGSEPRRVPGPNRGPGHRRDHQMMPTK
jgi:hypothetical protein